MKILPRDIETLIEIFEASEWDELHLQADGLELFLSSDASARLPGSASSSSEAAALRETASQPGDGAATRVPAAPSGERAASAAPVPEHWVAIKAPNLGTFYRAPKPGAPAFVEIGQTVEAHTEICLLEVMKLFTTLKAGTRGVVKKVCVKDAVMVEHGDVLFYIEPA